MKIKTSKIGDTCEHSQSSGSEAGKCNQTDDLESELKKSITDDDEALDSISADHDTFSVQENDVVQTPLQRQWNEFGEAINEDYNIPKPLRAKFPQATLADDKDSNQEKTISTLQSLQEQWKQIDEECSPYSAQNIKMTQIKAEREELLETMKRLVITSPGSALNAKFEKLNDLDKRRADLQTVIDSNISKKNDLEYKLRTNYLGLDEEVRPQLSSSLRDVLFPPPTICIEPVKEKCGWNDLWIFVSRIWTCIFFFIGILDTFLFIFIFRENGLVLIFLSFGLNLFLATRSFECSTPSRNVKIRLAFSVLKMFLQCIWLLVSMILSKGDSKFIFVFVSCEYFLLHQSLSSSHRNLTGRL